MYVTNNGKSEKQQLTLTVAESDDVLLMEAFGLKGGFGIVGWMDSLVI
jgi:hypothetical protein